jgi:effector-binding domain-containing protein
MTVDQIPIGRFSVITRLTQKALRYYEQKGLLVPEAKDTITGYRYYTGSQIQQGVKIRHLTDLGFTLDETQRYLQAEKENEKELMEKLIDSSLRKAERQLAELQRNVFLLRNRQTVKNTMLEPVIKETKSQRVLSKRELGRYEETIGKLIEDLMGTIMSPDNQRNFVKITGPFQTIYHDKDYKEDGADIEVAVPITGRIVIDDLEIEVKNLKPKKVVSLIYKGPYDSIAEGYEAILKYIQENDFEINGSMRDIYLNVPKSVEPEDLMTEIQIPIK